jgi:predicted PurR-regulated permease PerM
MSTDRPASEHHDIHGVEADFADLDPGLSEREQQASRNRLIQIVLGIFLIAIGIPMIPLTGPGWAVILVGLNMVWPDNPVVPWLRKKLPVVPDEGPIPRHYYVIGGLLMVVGIVVSFLFGEEATRWARDVTGI